jgi:hypothetical protein
VAKKKKKQSGGGKKEAAASWGTAAEREMAATAQEAFLAGNFALVRQMPSNPTSGFWPLAPGRFVSWPPWPPSS